MIYQVNNEFKFFTYQATYSYKEEDRKEYLESSDEFEKRLLERIKMDLMNEAMLKGQYDAHIKDEDITLPLIKYVKLVHSDMEEARLKKCNDNKVGNLDDVRYYVEKGAYPPYDHSLKMLEIQDLKKENVKLKMGQAELLEQGLQEKERFSKTMAQIVEYTIK